VDRGLIAQLDKGIRDRQNENRVLEPRVGSNKERRTITIM